MQLSEAQGRVASQVEEWYNSPSSPQIFRLFGYAGTGKSTIAETVLAQLDVSFCSATFTGKAAAVLRRKGLKGTTTLHSLCYKVVPPSMEKVKAKLKEIEAAPSQDVARMKEELRDLQRPRFVINEDSPLHDVDLLLVDECSMVDEELGNDILSFGKKVLVLGDPGQLPPIKGTGFFTSASPDALLTEIHRQAANNPIIRMATDVRSGKRLSYGAYGDSVVKHRSKLSPDELVAASQILVGRNATRRGRNTLLRSLRGYRDPLPLAGDRVICLKNDAKAGLLNGLMYEVVERSKDRWINLSLVNADDPDDRKEVSCHEEVFLGRELDEMPFWLRKLAQEFDYAYAITVHKSQGSQWRDVVIENESWCFREDANRWLYTVLTRAEERVIVSM